MIDFDRLEGFAKRLCESRNGAGSWDTKHRKRAIYRKRVSRMLVLCESQSISLYFNKRAAK